MGNMIDDSHNVMPPSSRFENEKRISGTKLPRAVMEILQDAFNNGLKDGALNLYTQVDSFLGWKSEAFERFNSLWGNGIDSKGASVLFDKLKDRKSTISSINLSINELDDGCMRSLGQYLQINPYIERINVGNNNINDKAIDILVEYLQHNITLKELDIHQNQNITDKSIKKLINTIESTKIEKIKSKGTSINVPNAFVVPLVINTLKNGSEKIIFREKEIDDGDMKMICNAIETLGCENLKEIRLQGNVITSVGATLLFNTLKNCSSKINWLNLSNNELDDGCILPLGEYMQSNPSIEYLWLGSNQFTDKGIEIFVDYLFGNSTIKDLGIFGNKHISDNSVPYLIELAKRSTISRLFCDDTSISLTKKEEIRNALAVPLDQRELPIPSNSKSAAKVSQGFFQRRQLSLA